MNENSNVSEWVDPDDAPELGEDFFAHGEIRKGGVLVRPATATLGGKRLTPVTLSLSDEVIAFFRARGVFEEWAMARVLDEYVAAQVAKAA